MDFLTVTGLSFTPTIVAIYNDPQNMPMGYIDTSQGVAGNGFIAGWEAYSGNYRFTGNATITSGGFSLPCGSSDNLRNWIAFE
jgi:hypothetical protein